MFSALMKKEVKCVFDTSYFTHNWETRGGRQCLIPFRTGPKDLPTAGVNTASLSECLHSSKTRTRWAERFHDEFNGHMFDLERDGIRQVVLRP